MQTRFPLGLVCYLCFAPFGAPFNHEVPAQGTKYKGELCKYPDVLKELTYIVYQNEQMRAAVFARLRRPNPSTLTMYWRSLARILPSGLLGIYEVLAAFLDLKEAGHLGGNTGH